MEFDEIEIKSSPGSWSTCDLGTLQDVNCLLPKPESEKNCIRKVKKQIKTIFLDLKNSAAGLPNTLSDILNHINSTFCERNAEILCEKLNYRCCNQQSHNFRCIKKWKNVKHQLLTFAKNSFEQPKPIFLIRKKQTQSSKLLLSDSQPHWIHRMFLKSYLVMGNN